MLPVQESQRTGQIDHSGSHVEEEASKSLNYPQFEAQKLFIQCVQGDQVLGDLSY